MFKGLQLTRKIVMKCQQNTLGLVRVATIFFIISAACNNASAQWGSRGGGGSTGSYVAFGYGSSGGGYGGSGGFSGGSTGGTGPMKRLVARMQNNRFARHAYRQNSGYGSSGGYSSTGGFASTGGYGSMAGYSSTGGYGSAGGHGSSGGYGSAGGAFSSHQGGSDLSIKSRTLANVSQAPLSQNSRVASSAVSDSTIQLAVTVPNGAKLFVNEQATISTGATRLFVSRNLQREKKYEFRVRAEIMDKNGTLITEMQQVSVKPGESESLQFTFESRSPVHLATRSK